MTDDELRSLLREWEAPRAPTTLRQRVLPKRQSAWDWFPGRERRLMMSFALAAVVLLFSSLWVLRHRRAATGTLSDFEPVTEFQPRIVRNIP